jgi:aminoglycoside phosphotransferase (APT) family kinase protein
MSPLDAALASAFPDATVTEVDEQTTRPGNRTARVAFAERDPAYLKVQTDGATRIRREIAATRHAAAHAGLRVPTVIGADARGEGAAPPYLATEPLPGTLFNEPWTDDGDREALLRRVGRAVGAVHEARFDAVGDLTGWDGARATVADTAWTETLCAVVEERGTGWFCDRFAALPGEVIETIRAVEPTLDGVTPRLVHADPSRINLHVEPLGLLDWERALVGDPAYGLVEAEFHHLDQPDVSDDERAALLEALHAGYRDRRGELPPTLERYGPLYRAIAHLLVPQAFDDWASDVDRPLDELEAEVREEANRRLAAAQEECGAS